MKFPYHVLCESSGRIPCVTTAWAEGCPLPDAYINNRPVYFGDIEHGGDADESYFLDACYADTLEDLDEDALEQLTSDHAMYLAEQWFEHQICRAERAFEGDR